MSGELLLSIEDGRVEIGGKPFFEGLTFHIQAGAKIALVGRNGAGKTTLMNLVSGARELDDGKRFLQPGTRIGYMQQQAEPLPGVTVDAYLRAVAEKPLEPGEYDDTDLRIAEVLAPLDLEAGWTMDHLSGGQLRRAALARALIEAPDILLLDEPTNHLDLDIIEWMEGYIKRYRGAMLCVSHDRAFLANITDRVFWLDRGALRVSPRGFRYFEEWSSGLLEQEARDLHNREKRVEQELEWANRGVKARVKRNVRRVRLAHEEAEALEADRKSFRRATAKIEVPPADAREAGMNIAEFFNVDKAFQDPEAGTARTILEKFSLRIRRGEKIGILGRNGSGKTSFLRLLTGELKPDAGKVKLAHELEFRVFDQRREGLAPDKTLQDNLCESGADHLWVRGKWRHVCGYLKDYLFDPKDAWRPVSTLSGGQMNRLMLARVLAEPGSFLILDEPTNDLDMDTLDMLIAVLQAYDGTLIVVSHDRDFLDRVVDKLLVFEGEGHIEQIIGGYDDYLAWRQARRSGELDEPASARQKKAPQGAKPSAWAGEKDRSRPKPKRKLSFKEKHALEHLPREIEKLESELAAHEAALADPDLYTRDPAAFTRHSEGLVAAREKLDAAETRWLELEALREELEGG